MLAPLFDLPTSRRGVATFSAEMLNAVFDPTTEDADFKRVRRMRLEALNPPFTKGVGLSAKSSRQESLDL